MNKQVVIVGSGFSGATCARVLAENNYEVTIVEKQSHIAGNAYDFLEDNIYVHKYGPHIFHTNDEEVFNFLSNYTKWFKYEHKVLAKLKDKYIPVPFNMQSLKMCFPENESENIEKLLREEYGNEKKISILELKQNKNEVLKKVADFVANNIFIKYSQKQWGTTIDKLDPNTISRVPVYISYEDRYFTDKFQYQPLYGYTKLFENLLNHPNISIKYNTEAKNVLKIKDGNIYFEDKLFDGIVIFTGPIDEFLDNKFGKLPYRSLNFCFVKYNEESYQPSAVVNYTIDQDFTRISEFKKFTTANPPKDKTIIIKEYSLAYEQNKNMIPYYPIINPENSSIYQKYQDYCGKIQNFYLLGRLGSYKYINMDIAVKNAIELCKQIIK